MQKIFGIRFNKLKSCMARLISIVEVVVILTIGLCYCNQLLI